MVSTDITLQRGAGDSNGDIRVRRHETHANKWPKQAKTHESEAKRRCCTHPLGASEGCEGGAGALRLLVIIVIMLQRGVGGGFQQDVAVEGHNGIGSSIMHRKGYFCCVCRVYLVTVL